MPHDRRINVTVTVGIPTTGELPTRRRIVEATMAPAALVSPDAEILVVVNGRGDAPGLGRIDSPMVRVMHLAERNVSAARNCAITHARHDTLLFADDDGMVPEPWCTELHAALTGRGWPVVTAPVRVPVSGPVTALIDYQRIFDAPPAGPEVTHTLTGNCGLRASMIPSHVRYNEAHLPTAAEDVDFSFALRAAGLKIHWLADATPGLHCLPENIDEITERGVRYGRGGARLYLLRGNKKIAIPGALSWYASMAAGEHREYRRFPEFTLPGVRVAFTVYEYLLNACLLIGYLDELGAQLGHPLIEPDYQALSAAWQEISASAAEGVRGLSASDWDNLPTDYGRLERGVDPPDPVDAAVASVSAGA